MSDSDGFRDYLIGLFDSTDEILTIGASNLEVNRIMVRFKGKAYWVVIE